jgi:hypothetical protein
VLRSFEAKLRLRGWASNFCCAFFAGFGKRLPDNDSIITDHRVFPGPCAGGNGSYRPPQAIKTCHPALPLSSANLKSLTRL